MLNLFLRVPLNIVLGVGRQLFFQHTWEANGELEDGDPDLGTGTGSTGYASIW